MGLQDMLDVGYPLQHTHRLSSREPVTFKHNKTSAAAMTQDDDYTNYDDDNEDESPLFSVNGTRIYRTHHHHHKHSYSNYTYKTSVTIRVTPYNNYFVSWGILWGCFVLASLLAFFQILKERKILARRRQAVDDVENSLNAPTDGEHFSSADVTRSLFRRLLLLAMIARVLVTPMQIWSDPMWCQFFSDTFPEMIFASAWSMLVTFFIQLVGIALGTGTNSSPGIVIQATAYVVYLLLVCIQLFNNVASILMYALLCCIYAALFGTVIYFCPRLVSLLQPSLVRYGGLKVRLLICTLLCILTFWAQVIRYARLVVAPPKKVYWWYNYGILELIPATILLLLMHPKSEKASRDDEPIPTPDDVSFLRKAAPPKPPPPPPPPPPSSGRGGQETTSLLKGSATYGSTGES